MDECIKQARFDDETKCDHQATPTSYQKTGKNRLKKAKKRKNINNKQLFIFLICGYRKPFIITCSTGFNYDQINRKANCMN